MGIINKIDFLIHETILTKWLRTRKTSRKKFKRLLRPLPKLILRNKRKQWDHLTQVTKVCGTVYCKETHQLKQRLWLGTRTESASESPHLTHPNTKRCLTIIFKLQVGPVLSAWVAKISALLSWMMDLGKLHSRLSLTAQCQTSQRSHTLIQVPHSRW